MKSVVEDSVEETGRSWQGLSFVKMRKTTWVLIETTAEDKVKANSIK
jgi:hypothetical protein